MDTAYFFSDENGQHTGGRYYVVAGVALTKYRNWTADEIHHAERASGKGKQDWKGTKNIRQRTDYLERIFAIPELKGSIFYAAYEDHGKAYWDCTVDALQVAICRFAPRAHCIVRHQGFGFKTREKLKASLAGTGLSFEVQSGAEKRCEIRLADALAGFVGLVKYSGSKQARFYPDLPDWIIDLKNEAPVQV